MAIARLKEAVSEIKAANRTDPIAAGDGAVALMERLWPAFQEIDTSSGALGSAVNAALADIIPILIAAPATPKVRAAWLERLYDAVQEDGVQYLYPAEERWGEIAVYPELMNAYADLLLPLLRRVWCTEPADRYVAITGQTICLSCLLEVARHQELLDLLTNARNRFWSDQLFGAEALTRQGHHDAALAFADGCRRASIQRYDHREIDRFCERVLLQAGREEEAYRRYGPPGGWHRALPTRAACCRRPPRRRRGRWRPASAAGRRTDRPATPPAPCAAQGACSPSRRRTGSEAAGRARPALPPQRRGQGDGLPAEARAGHYPLPRRRQDLPIFDNPAVSAAILRC